MTDNGSLVGSLMEHDEVPSESIHAGNFLDESAPLEMVFKNLTYTVKLREPVKEEETPIVNADEGEPPVNQKKRKKKFWQRKKFTFVEKTILDDITGIFRPGRLTAIMGTSGAGKTTLLSVLAGNISGGVFEGEISINGEDFGDPKKMKKISGFVFQDDVLLPTMKVKEAIKMSALLRLPKEVTLEERDRRVDEIIKVLHLKRAADTKVGDPIKKGISGGERKRTSIAMEVITNPAMLFLDEPTSGLDTYTAYTVIKTLQNLAHKQGRTIISTIHQPSSEIFYLFDDLMLLADGKVVYYGPVGDSISYFAERGYPCTQYTNPADYFFMNILSDIDGTTTGPVDDKRETRPASWVPAGVKEKASERIQRLIGDWPKSEEHTAMVSLLEASRSSGVPALSYKGHASYWTQFWFLANRASKNAIRNKSIVTVRLFQSIFIGVLVGLIFINQGQYPAYEQVRNFAGVLFFFAVNQYFASANQVISIFYEEKTVFFREYYAGYYRVSAYYWTKILCELPYGIVMPFLMVIIAYYIIGLKPAFSAYLLCGFYAMMAGLCGTATGILIASIFEEIGTALAVLPVVLLPLLLFSGLFANPNAVPKWLGWLQYISPMKYAFDGMVINQFTNNPPKNCNAELGECDYQYAINLLGLQNATSTALNIILLFVIWIVLLVAAFLVLWGRTHLGRTKLKSRKEKQESQEKRRWCRASKQKEIQPQSEVLPFSQ